MGQGAPGQAIRSRPAESLNERNRYRSPAPTAPAAAQPRGVPELQVRPRAVSRTSVAAAFELRVPAVTEDLAGTTYATREIRGRLAQELEGKGRLLGAIVCYRALRVSRIHRV
jgi:hypothetical protein